MARQRAEIFLAQGCRIRARFAASDRFSYQVATGDYGILPIALGGMTYRSGVWATAL
jgi:hypothetical protein